MLLTWLLGSCLLLLASGETGVHILSNQYGNQLITSSTLNWIQESHYSASKNFVIGGRVIVQNPDNPSDPSERPIFVCRARHNGIMVVGGQREGEERCTVTLSGSVKSYTQYQLLENVDSAARLNWTQWTKFVQPPIGSVATDKLYVARHIAQPDSNDAQPSQSHYIGTLSAQESLGIITYVKEDGTEGSADRGELLVETEPISYGLTNVKLNNQRTRIMKHHTQKLSEVTLSNTGDQPVKVAESIPYNFVYSSSWGPVQATFKGLNTTVILQNKTRLPDVKWGVLTSENRTNIQDVEMYLEPGTAVNVTLRGEYTDKEVPYSAKLYSHYEDGATRTARTISGLRHEAGITKITVDYSPIYFLGNFSLAPTTEPPPTTESVTVTTTQPTTMRLTTPTTTIRQQQQTERQEANAEEEPWVKDNDENAILKQSAPGMQGDDGGPQSLNAKAEGGSDNGALGIQGSLLLLLAGLLLANRVT